jgi:hypothetical protein
MAKRGPKGPSIIIDHEELEKLAGIHCTMIEMATFFDCSVDTLERNYAEPIKKGKEKGKISLRRLQYQAAQKGNITMMIWLGKQLLGQKDISRLELTDIPDEVFQKEAERRLKLVENP